MSHSTVFSPSHRSVKVSSPICSSAPAVTSTASDLKIPLEAADAAAVDAVNGKVLATKETGTYVLKPFRSPKSKKLKTAVVFVPRLSPFDIENEQSNKNEFRVRSQPSIRGPSQTYTQDSPRCRTRIGVLHALLDFDLLMGGSHVRSKHRNTGRTAQSAICDHVLERRSYVGA